MAQAPAAKVRGVLAALARAGGFTPRERGARAGPAVLVSKWLSSMVFFV